MVRDNRKSKIINVIIFIFLLLVFLGVVFLTYKIYKSYDSKV
jgi:hypothetical protein